MAEYQSFQIKLEREEFLFGVVSEFGNKLHENKEEQYVLFIVKELMSYTR